MHQQQDACKQKPAFLNIESQDVNEKNRFEKGPLLTELKVNYA